MLVKKIESQQKQQVTISLQEKTVGRIADYMALYHSEYGETIDRGSLIEEMLNVAMSRDKEFKKYEKGLSEERRDTVASGGAPDMPASNRQQEG